MNEESFCETIEEQNMPISMTSAKCPECGATISNESDRKIAFCTYCGTKILLKDENEYTIRTIDEAGIKTAEARIAEAEATHAIRMKEMEMAEKSSKNTRPVAFVCGALGLVFVLIAVLYHIEMIPNATVNEDGKSILGMLFLMGIFLILCSIVIAMEGVESARKEQGRKAGMINYPYIHYDQLKKTDYTSMMEILTSAGFSKVKAINMSDLMLKSSKKRKKVERVMINGEPPESDRWYEKDAEIVITYHGIPGD